MTHVKHISWLAIFLKQTCTRKNPNIPH